MHTTHNATYRRQARQPVSARRGAAYERAGAAAVLSERFFNSRVKLAAVCPETALMYAVLEDAFLCFHKQLETEQRSGKRARQAEDWFFHDNSRWLFSFLSICDALGLEPHYIRKKLKHWASRLGVAPAMR